MPHLQYLHITTAQKTKSKGQQDEDDNNDTNYDNNIDDDDDNDDNANHDADHDFWMLESVVITAIQERQAQPEMYAAAW